MKTSPAFRFRKRVAAILLRLEDAEQQGTYQEKVNFCAEALGRLQAAREEFGSDWPAFIHRLSEGCSVARLD